MKKLLGSVFALLLLSACGAGVPDVSQTDDEDDVHLFEDYLSALFDQESFTQLRGLVVYVDPVDFEIIMGEALPEECLIAERDLMMAHGVDEDSTVTIVEFLAEEVGAEGLDEPISHGIVTGQFSATAGSTVGRGLERFVDRSYVQMLPTATCDALVAQAREHG